MIFLIFFGLIFVVALSFYLYDAYNISQIQKYFESKKCYYTSYDKGTYHGVCPGGIIMIDNGFDVNMHNAEKIPQSAIKTIQVKKDIILISNEKQKWSLEFSNHANAIKFYENIKK